MKIDVSVGELVDKATILTIKTQKISEKNKHFNCRKELNLCLTALKEVGIDDSNTVFTDLLAINMHLWKLEDEIRYCEKMMQFDDTFIQIARLIYKLNDNRAVLKKKINVDYQSDIIEEKEYIVYKQPIAIRSRIDSINEDNAELFLMNVSNHNIDNDSDYLISHIPHNKTVKLLDVGFGSGMLLSKLQAQGTSVKLYGIEKSEHLFQTVGSELRRTGIQTYYNDFLKWNNEDKYDIVVMSFFLHHVSDYSTYLKAAFSKLNNTGQIVIMDRIAIDEKAKKEFIVYWDNHYKSAHEWEEEQPIIFTRRELIEISYSLGYHDIKFYQVPNDTRNGTTMFPKTVAVIKKSDQENQ